MGSSNFVQGHAFLMIVFRVVGDDGRPASHATQFTDDVPAPTGE